MTSEVRRRLAPPRNPAVVALAASAVLAVAAVAFAVHQVRGSAAPAAIRPSGIPASVPTSTADLMGLSSLPGQAAPNFSLVDQHGVRLSPASFRGHPLVLEFMDPHCTDICPIVSQEFIKAYKNLGPGGAKITFLAINVNPFHTAVADVLGFSHEQGLDTIPGWHFVTGSVPSLKAVWSEYGISVDAPNAQADVIHSSEIFFIDSHGVERYSAAPMVFHTASGSSYLPAPQITEWGQGIAQVVQNLS